MTAPRSEIESNVVVRFREATQGEPVGLGEVGHVNVVADGGAIGSGIVGAID